MIRSILKHAKDGAEVVYIPATTTRCPGPGCRKRRTRTGFQVAGIEVRARSTAHGLGQAAADHCTGTSSTGWSRYAKFLAQSVAGAYAAALVVNRWFNAMRRDLRIPHGRPQPVAQAPGARGGQGNRPVLDSAERRRAAKRGFDGVVCGHIHHAEMRDGGAASSTCNTGDWVESCTALVEHGDGRLELVDWAARNKLSFFRSRSAPVPAEA